MASNVALPWKRAANKSVFKVDMSSEPGHLLATPTAAHQPATARNMGACARCAGMRKRCNMSPPYSSMNCEACDTAKVPCPPHKERKSRKKVSEVNRLANPSENIVPDAIESATNIVAETLSEDIAMDIPHPEVAFMYNVLAPASQSIVGLDGATFPDGSFESSNIFAPGIEDWLVQFLRSLTDS